MRPQASSLQQNSAPPSSSVSLILTTLQPHTAMYSIQPLTSSKTTRNFPLPAGSGPASVESTEPPVNAAAERSPVVTARPPRLRRAAVNTRFLSAGFVAGGGILRKGVRSPVSLRRASIWAYRAIDVDGKPARCCRRLLCGIVSRFLKRRRKNESYEFRYNCVKCGWHYEIDSEVPADLIFVGRFFTMLLNSVIPTNFNLVYLVGVLRI